LLSGASSIRAFLGLQMVDLSERENGVWKRERGDHANAE